MSYLEFTVLLYLIISYKVPHPQQARLKSIVTHMLFGLGLFISAKILILL